MSTEARQACGLRLRGMRTERGLSQAALASLLNVEQATVSRWETGKKTPSFETRLLLCSTLGADPYAIVPAEKAS